MGSKRGLNQAVTTLLLVALAILALILIWFYLKPAITDFSKQAERTECTTLRLEPASCTIVPSEEDEGYYSIQLKRNPGAETIKLRTAKLHLTFSDGTSTIKEITNLPDTISQTINLDIPFSDPDIDSNTIVGIKAAALIEYKDAIKACSFSETEIGCQLKREAIEYPSKGTKSGTTPETCEGDTTWVNLNTYYEDFFSDGFVSEFFAEHFYPPWQEAWTLDKDNGLLISKRDDKTEYQFVALEGNFILEMGMRLSHPKSSFGIYLNETDLSAHPTYTDIIALKWYEESSSGIQALRAYRDIFTEKKRSLKPFFDNEEDEWIWFNRRKQFASPQVLMPIPPPLPYPLSYRDVDIRLTRTDDTFLWEYRFPPPEGDNIWQKLAEETFDEDFNANTYIDPEDGKKKYVDTDAFYRHTMGPKLSLIFDEGTGQALRYIQFQSEKEGTFPCEKA